MSCVNPVMPKFTYILFKNPVRTSKKASYFTITEISWLTLFKEIIAVYTENHTKRIEKKHELLVVETGRTFNYR
jgi:hypothetical protein